MPRAPFVKKAVLVAAAFLALGFYGGGEGRGALYDTFRGWSQNIGLFVLI